MVVDTGLYHRNKELVTEILPVMQPTILTIELIKSKVVEHMDITHDRFKFLAMVFNTSSCGFFVQYFAVDKTWRLLGHAKKDMAKSLQGFT